MSGAALAGVNLSALLGGRDGPVRDDETDDFAAAAELVVRAGARMDLRGWVPATAGNISVRLDDAIAITRSGCHKGFLTAADVIRVDGAGRALDGGRPSAETLLHCQLYDADPATGAVLHGHSVAATVLSLHASDTIILQGYEVQKAFAGQVAHDGRIALPVFDNDQDIARLAGVVAPALARGLPAGYVIRGHGVYAWGPDMPTALARLEALEFLLACELERARLR